MKNKLLLNLFKMPTLILFGLSLARAENGPSASEVVNQFCLVDYSGARLQTMETDPIWRLTTGDGEPPAEPIIVKGWRIVSETRAGSGTDVVVSYDIVGNVTGEDQSLAFTPSTHEENQAFHLSAEKSGWKIQMETLKISPHVSVASERYHLKELVRLITAKPPPETSKLRAISRILEQLKTYGPVYNVPADPAKK